MVKKFTIHPPLLFANISREMYIKKNERGNCFGNNCSTIDYIYSWFSDKVSLHQIAGEDDSSELKT